MMRFVRGPRTTSSGALLTARQMEVAMALCGDKPIKEIAFQLGVSPKTVEYHWGVLKRKLGVGSYVGLVLWMIRSGVLNPYETETKTGSS